MNLTQLTWKHPIVASCVVLSLAIILTEIPVPATRALMEPLLGRFYGDYATDLLMNGVGGICLVLLAGIAGLGGKIGLRRPVSWRTALLGWPVILLSLLNGSDVLLGDRAMVFDPILLAILLLLFLSVGLFEEVLLRGYVQGFLMRRWGNNRRGIILSVLLANILFACAHLINLLAGRSTPMHAVAQLVYSFFFGVFFSALYLRTRSLIPSIVLHLLFDFMAALPAFLPGALPRSEILQTVAPESALISILVCSPLLLIGLFYLRKDLSRPWVEDPVGGGKA